jgi:hypothetical protein
MPALVVPGVRVEARFDVLPPLPAPSGILGAVGIVDRPPAEGGLIGVTKAGEVRELLGMGTEASMPEVIHALANGASEAVISPVAGGGPASVTLMNQDVAPAVILRVRSNGLWGRSLRADVRGIADAAGNIVRVGLRLLRDGQVVESFEDLQVVPGQPDDLFDTINRRSKYVVALDPGFTDAARPRDGSYVFSDVATTVNVPEDVAADPRPLFQLSPADGVAATGLRVQLTTTGGRTRAQVFQGGLQEDFRNLVMNPDSAQYLPYVLLTQSRFVRVTPLSSLAADRRLPAPTTALAEFAGGASPSVDDYRAAIERLADDPRIDLVLASIEPGRPDAEVRQIHQALVAHAVAMADAGAPRIAFGSVTANEAGDLGRIRDHAAAIRNRRFVLVAPPGAEGAVAGMIGRTRTEDSPTFKPAPLFGIAPSRYRESELNRLLGPSTNLLVVQDRAGRGVVVLKGIDTTGDQVSVTRVADEAIRETKAISENFIGVLNSEEARIALKQQLIATFTRMERRGALVPSTDNTDPAFIVDVYSTQTDFAQGIVRIDIAVRPVRAIDYIYATIRVKN